MKQIGVRGLSFHLSDYGGQFHCSSLQRQTGLCRPGLGPESDLPDPAPVKSQESSHPKVIRWSGPVFSGSQEMPGYIHTECPTIKTI